MSQDNFIKIRGAKAHNLKDVDVDIPRNKLVVITGVSGSGKSSLVFDVLYAEGQRRYLESLSSYARQFLGVSERPNVEKIEGISPAIAITPKKGAKSPRSTVGTITEIYDYLRLLYAKIGKPLCPICHNLLTADTIDGLVKKVLRFSEDDMVTVLAPIVRRKKGEHKEILFDIKRKGFLRVRIDGQTYKTDELPFDRLEEGDKHDIDVVIDNFLLEKTLDNKRVKDSVELALRAGKGLIIISNTKKEVILSKNFYCEKCETFLQELEPRIFSFNNPIGACEECTGLGEKMEIVPELLLPNKNLTFDEGAILPMASQFCKERGRRWCYEAIKEFSDKYKFPMDEPVKDISPKMVDAVLFGDGKLEGVIAKMERKYKESQSEWTHHEIEAYMVTKVCPKCQGKRLKPEVLAIKVFGKSIDEMAKMSLIDLQIFLKKEIKNKSNFLGINEFKIAETIIGQIIKQLEILSDVSLEYLSLDRKATTISGGEEQRIRLAVQIGAKLNGILYVLDEPSVGLHPKDQEKLIKIMEELKDLGNTVIVVEHDPQTIKNADWIIDIGPGAGKNGGEIIFEGTVSKFLKSKTLTGEYLSGKKKIEVTIKNKKSTNNQSLIIKGASENNLKNLDVRFPLEKFICITGVSGSGKSSLIDDILAKALLKKFYRAKNEPGSYKEISGTEFINKVVLVDQAPIGRTPRSNPATYTGAFTFIRDVFAKTREARLRGFTSGKFSFNAKGGRCEACEGQGQIKVEMYFMPDIYIECSECKGTRYKKEVLDIDYQGKNIADVLDMTIEEAMKFFKDTPGLYPKLETLSNVGLPYMKLGQPAPSLSGGEAQRVKLATELSRKDTGKTLYILDEPTTGLHFDDIKKLLFVLKSLVAKGNTVLCVEHNIDLIKNADWVIDLGPGGGVKGGEIVAQGTPTEIKKNKKSFTGRYL